MVAYAFNFSTKKGEVGAGRCLWVSSQQGLQSKTFSQKKTKKRGPIPTIAITARFVVSTLASTGTQYLPLQKTFALQFATVILAICPPDEDCQLPFSSCFLCIPGTFQWGKMKTNVTGTCFFKNNCVLSLLKKRADLPIKYSLGSQFSFLHCSLYKC